MSLEALNAEFVKAIQSSEYDEKTLNTIDLCLKVGVKVNVNMDICRSRSALTIAIRRPKSSAVVKKLLDAGANIEHLELDSWTPLLIAARNCEPEIVKILLEHGANIKHLSTMNASVLMLAVASGNEEKVKLLIASGAEVNGQDINGMGVLHRTTTNKNLTQILLDAGADVSFKTNGGKTALDMAKESGSPDVVLLLTEAENKLRAAEEEAKAAAEKAKAEEEAKAAAEKAKAAAEAKAFQEAFILADKELKAKAVEKALTLAAEEAKAKLKKVVETSVSSDTKTTRLLIFESNGLVTDNKPHRGPETYVVDKVSITVTPSGAYVISF